MEFGNVNFLAVLAAAAAYMIVGFAWYAPPVLGNRWMALVGKSREELGSPAPKFAVAVVAALLSSYVLALIVQVAPALTAAEGALVGFLAWAGFAAASGAVSYVFAARPWALLAIDLGYHLVALAVAGAILAGWP